MTSDSHQEWKILIGDFVLTCGNLELFLHQIYWNLTLNDEKFDEFKRLIGIKMKVRLLRSTLEERFNGDVFLKDVSSVFSQVIEVAGVRNLIVHNPLFMDVFADDGGNLKLSPSIRSLRDYEKGITLSELQEVNAKALKVAENMQVLLEKLTAKLFP